MEKIINILKSNPEICYYRITEMKKESCELFYVLKNLETNRATNIIETEVSVYVKVEDKIGSSSVTIYQYMDEQEIKDVIDGGVKAAKLALNKYFELPKPTGEKATQLTTNMDKEEFVDVIDKIVASVFKADIYENGWINSTEFFLTKRIIHIVNSNGIDQTYTSYEGDIEVIPTWSNGKEEFELYKMIKFSSIDYDDITEQVKEVLLQAKARSEAIKPTIPEGTKVIISGEDVPSIFSYFKNDLAYSQVYQKVNMNPIGTNCQGDKVDGDKLTITLVPDVEGSIYSCSIDEDGIVLKPVCIIDEGIVKSYYGNNLFGYYLGIEHPTGNIRNMVVNSGSKTIQEMKKEPYVECVKFSAFQCDRMTGYFGGEVRLGYYFDGEKVFPVTGFAISGSLQELRGELVLSKEMMVRPGYKGPKSVEINGMKIA